MTADAQDKSPSLRWGIVGTGSISTNMGGRHVDAYRMPNWSAVSSRRMSSAQAFASDTRHRADRAFDSWADMAGIG